MTKLGSLPKSEYTPLMQTLFGHSSPSSIQVQTSLEASEVTFFDPTLNDSQKDAIRFALASRELALIHGPPGVSARTFQLSIKWPNNGRRVKRIRWWSSFGSF